MVLADIVPLDMESVLNKLREITLENQELQNKLKQHDILLDTMLHNIWIADPQGQINYCNERGLQYGNRKFEQIMGDKWLSLLHPDDVQMTKERWEHALRTGELYESEYRLQAADQTYRWFLARATPLRNEQGEIIKWYGTCTDIDEHKRLVQALQETTAHFELVFEAVKLGIWNRDFKDDMVLANSNALRFHGLIPDGQPKPRSRFLDTIHPDDQEKIISFCMPDELPNYRVEYRTVWPDGSVHFLEAHGRVYLDEQTAKVIRVMGVILDITERKENEQKLYQQQRELAHSMTMHSMGEIVNSLAHELNQPLTVVSTFAQLALSQLKANNYITADLTHFLQQIVRQTQHAGLIIQRIRNCTHSERLLLEAVDFNAVVANAIELSSYEQFSSRPKLQFFSIDKLPPIEVDKTQIKQVIINLIRNSIEAMEEANTPHPVITVRLKMLDAQTLNVSIADNGPGIPEKLRTSIWEAYFSTKKEGMGMGLAICRNIVEAHGGHLYVSTSNQTGACFEFTLPIKQESVI